MYQESPTTTANQPPTGVWLGSGRPVSIPDPCNCDDNECYRDASQAWRCDCYGRRDWADLPRWCCSRVYATRTARALENRSTR